MTDSIGNPRKLSAARTILAIETSNPSSGAGGVCAARLEGNAVEILGRGELDASVRASDGVMVAVASACDSGGITARDVDAIAVSIGPGGYTALRIAATTAKTLAFACDCPVVPVPTWAVARESIGPEQRPALIALAGKGDHAHLTVIAPDGSPTHLGVVGPGAIQGGMASVLVGDGHVPGAIVDKCLSLGMTRASIVLRGEACASASLGFDAVGPDAFEPAYAREPDAVTQWRARHEG